MAKTKPIEVNEVAEVTLEDTKVVTDPSTEETAPTEEVVNTSKKETPVTTATTVVAVEVLKTKIVKVHAFKDHRCRVAGVQYFLEKGKEAEVPEDVAAILANANIVMKK